jgi:Tol biopolymer transport system component
VWSPDGKYLLVAGYSSAKALDRSSIDWWMASIDGNRLLKTGLTDALVHGGIRPLDVTRNSRIRTPVPSVPAPGCWQRGKNAVISSIESNDNRNLWEIGISPETGRVTGLPRRLTTGAGSEQSPACSSVGTLAFTNVQIERQLWLLPYDLNHGKSEGELRQVMENAADRENPSFSADGRYMAFVSDQSGRPNIWLKEKESGRETQIASSAFVQRYPLISPSGHRIAYSAYESDKRVVYVAEPGGAPEKLCEDCLRATDWSKDEKMLLVHGGNPYQIKLLTVASHAQIPLVRHDQYSLIYGHFSPDNRWISFTARIRADHAIITIAPATGTRPIPESAWITIADVGLDDYASWSPDGKILYFTSSKDGNNCLWGQRIDARTGRPSGASFAAQHFHGRISFGHGGWAIGGTRIGFALVETTSNVWTMWQ